MSAGNLKEIKRKIKSVKNTQKTTRAMKLVSTAKLRKAEEVAKKSRVYADKITTVLSEIAYKIDKYGSGVSNRLLQQIESPKKVDIVFVTADKGLCGGFNIQTIKTIKALLNSYKDKNIKVRLRGIGKKGIEYFKFNNVELLNEVKDLSSSPSYERASDFIADVIDDYLSETTDKIVIVYNGYKNMITQEIKILDLLPIDLNNCDKMNCTVKKSNSMIELEPEDYELVLEQLVRKYIEFNMYFALLDSLAAEHGARMQAMDSATNNAKELVKNLSLKYNKARQEAITTELVEIISGMEAMS